MKCSCVRLFAPMPTLPAYSPTCLRLPLGLFQLNLECRILEHRRRSFQALRMAHNQQRLVRIEDIDK